MVRSKRRARGGGGGGGRPLTSVPQRWRNPSMMSGDSRSSTALLAMTFFNTAAAASSTSPVSIGSSSSWPVCAWVVGWVEVGWHRRWVLARCMVSVMVGRLLLVKKERRGDGDPPRNRNRTHTRLRTTCSVASDRCVCRRWTAHDSLSATLRDNSGHSPR